jgi:hypothetical protein
MFFITNHYILPTPSKFYRYHLTPNQKYSDEIDRMVADLKKGGAVIYFSEPISESYQMPLADLRALPGIQEIHDTREVYNSGVISIFKYSGTE